MSLQLGVGVRVVVDPQRDRVRPQSAPGRGRLRPPRPCRSSAHLGRTHAPGGIVPWPARSDARPGDGDAEQMDFTYPPEAEAFRAEFRGVARRALHRRVRAPGTASPWRWTRRASPRCGAPGTVSSPTRGTRRSPGPRSTAGAAPGSWSRSCFAEEMHRAGAPGTRQRDRPLQHRPGDHRVRHRGAEGAAPAAHAPRRRHLVPGLLGARRGLRPRVAAVPGRARRRPLRGQRAEDVELARPRRELVRAPRAHRSRRTRSIGASRACSST